MDFITHQELVKQARMISRLSRLIKIAPALGAVAILPLLAACNERAASAPAQLERPVQVQRVDFTNENPAREFVGVVRARHENDLDFHVARRMRARRLSSPQQLPISPTPRPRRRAPQTSRRMPRSRLLTTTTRRLPRTRPKEGSNARNERSISHAISSTMRS